jgi:hypothetical protein
MSRIAAFPYPFLSLDITPPHAYLWGLIKWDEVARA